MKLERREKRPSCSSRRRLTYRLTGDLERELERKLHDSSSVLVHDLAEVIDRALREPEPTSRVASAGSVRAVTSRNGDPAIADCIQRQIDIAGAQGRGRVVERRRISLVEYVEESGPELKLLLFSDVEVLEEGDVEIASTRTPDIERRLRWASVREGRNSKLPDIQNLRPYACAAADSWIA